MQRSALVTLLWGASALAQLTPGMVDPALAQSPAPPNATLALVGGTIFAEPHSEPIEDGVVLLRGGTIVAVGSRRATAIPNGVSTLDCSGMTVTAGFWNSHVHFFERKWADAGSIPARELSRQLESTLTRFGFTSVFDTGSVRANTHVLRDRIDSGEVAGPSILTAGEALIAKNAMPPDRILAVLGSTPLPSPEIVDVDDAVAAAGQLLDDGVDGVKVHLQPPPPPHAPMPDEVLAAVVRVARRAGKPVFVHPHDGGHVLASVRAGVDVVAHTTPLSGPWDEDIIAAVKTSKVALTPTLTLWKFAMRHDRHSIQEAMVRAAVEQLRSWTDAGGTVLFGTDLGAVDPDPSEEYALMAAAGMSFGDILASLTTAPAEAFGVAERLGTIAPGRQADLTVIADDPERDARALAAVRYTIRQGRLLYDSTMTPR